MLSSVGVMISPVSSGIIDASEVDIVTARGFFAAGFLAGTAFFAAGFLAGVAAFFTAGFLAGAAFFAAGCKEGRTR